MVSGKITIRSDNHYVVVAKVGGTMEICPDFPPRSE